MQSADLSTFKRNNMIDVISFRALLVNANKLLGMSFS